LAGPLDSFGTTDGLGVNIHFTNPRPGEMAMLAAAGYRWVRMDFFWHMTETQAGHYDFSQYDTLMSTLTPYGIHPIFILDYGNSLYDNGFPPNDAAGRTAFANWVTAAVQHFQGRGIIWELWNEPNLDMFWQPHANVQDYIQLGLVVGQAIRATAPGEIFMGPTTSGIDINFLTACFQGGLLNYFDAVSVHPYRSGGPESVAADYARLRTLIDQYAPAGKFIPIVSGEWGFSATGIGDAQQGKLISREWLMNLSNNIPVSIWYDWHNDGTDPNNPEHNFGTVGNPYYPSRDPVYDPKPAYQAATNLTTLLTGQTFQNRLGLGQSNDYALAFSDGISTRFVAWTTSSSHNATLHIPQGSYQEISNLGANLGTVTAGASGLTLMLTDSPIYLVPPVLVAPPAPQAVLATVTGSDVRVTWTQPPGNVDGFTIERSDNDPNHYQLVGIVATPGFTDPNVPVGIHYYRLQAYNSVDSSPYSNISNAIIGPISSFTDHSIGFASHADLQLNGGATVSGTRLRLTDGGGSEARTAWTTTRVSVEGFHTSFTIVDLSGQGSADGLTFTLQNNDPSRVGSNGGNLGYGGIPHSVAVMFDMYSGGNHESTTKVWTNGVTDRTGAIDMGPSGIILERNRPLRVDLEYDLAQLTLTETVTDAANGKSFQHVYTNLNIPQLIGSSTAYAGFTAGTGGETSTQDIASWSGRFLDPTQPISHFGVNVSATTAGVPVTVTISALDAFNNVKPAYRGTVTFTSSDGLASLPADYTFTAADNGIHQFTATLGTSGVQSLTVTDTTSGIQGTQDVLVAPGPVAFFYLDVPAVIQAGVAFVVTVYAEDQFGNFVTNYGGTVTFSTSDPDPGVMLPADYTFQPSDGGVASFVVTLQTPGDQILAATDTAQGSVFGSAEFTVM
jgi:hypothetical protein